MMGAHRAEASCNRPAPRCLLCCLPKEAKSQPQSSPSCSLVGPGGAGAARIVLLARLLGSLRSKEV